MLVKITCGTYGYRNSHGVLTPKDSNSEPFELESKEAERLIAAGAAREVKVRIKSESEMIRGHLDPEQLRDINKKELEQLAKDMGIPSSGNKEELIIRIVQAEVEAETDDSENENGWPELNAEEPEV